MEIRVDGYKSPSVSFMKYPFTQYWIGCRIYGEKEGLITPLGNCDINIGKNGEVIYSNYGYGISIFDGKTFKNYDESNGLVDNRIWDLTVDSKNNIWMATDGSGVQI